MLCDVIKRVLAKGMGGTGVAVCGPERLCLVERKEFAHLSGGVGGAENGAAYGNALNAGVEQGQHVLKRDAADGAYRDAEVFAANGLHDFLVSVKPEDGGEAFLGGGEAERAATDVVGTPALQEAYFVDGVGRAANQVLVAKELAGLVHGHVIFAQVHAVGLYLLAKFHAVVKNEGSPGIAAGLKQAAGYGLYFLVGSPFHAQLYPFATALQGQHGRLFVGDGGRRMGDELYGYHKLKVVRLGRSIGGCRLRTGGVGALKRSVNKSTAGPDLRGSRCRIPNAGQAVWRQTF